MMYFMTDLFFYSTGSLLILFATTVTTHLTISIYRMVFTNTTKKKPANQKKDRSAKTIIQKPIKLSFGLYLVVNWALCCYSIGYLIMHMIASL